MSVSDKISESVGVQECYAIVHKETRAQLTRIGYGTRWVEVPGKRRKSKWGIIPHWTDLDEISKNGYDTFDMNQIERIISQAIQHDHAHILSNCEIVKFENKATYTQSEMRTTAKIDRIKDRIEARMIMHKLSV